VYRILELARGLGTHNLERAPGPHPAAVRHQEVRRRLADAHRRREARASLIEPAGSDQITLTEDIPDPYHR
jgi:hypothetical protein